MGERLPRYVIISPVRNEQRFIEKTLRAVAAQTVLPTRWLIVDDGSTDRTPELVARYARRYPFIKLIHHPQRPEVRNVKDRLAIAAEAKAFNFGLSRLEDDFDFIVKLDGDLSFNSDYFERLLIEFEKNPRLGLASGVARFPLKEGGFWLSWTPPDHVLGASKVFRKACFEAVGGIQEVLGWDTIDEAIAQLEGWETRSFEKIVLTHWRLMGSAAGALRGKYRHGVTHHYLGYKPMYMVARAVRRSIEPPYALGSAAMLAGYLSGFIKGKPKADPRVIKHLRAKQGMALRELPKKLLSSRGIGAYKIS